jgi:hypothetical protein
MGPVAQRCRVEARFAPGPNGNSTTVFQAFQDNYLPAKKNQTTAAHTD